MVGGGLGLLAVAGVRLGFFCSWNVSEGVPNDHDGIRNCVCRISHRMDGSARSRSTPGAAQVAGLAAGSATRHHPHLPNVHRNRRVPLSDPRQTAAFHLLLAIAAVLRCRAPD